MQVTEKKELRGLKMDTPNWGCAATLRALTGNKDSEYAQNSHKLTNRENKGQIVNLQNILELSIEDSEWEQERSFTNNLEA